MSAPDWAGVLGLLVLAGTVAYGVPLWLYRPERFRLAFFVSLPIAAITTATVMFVWLSPVAWYVVSAAAPAALRHGSPRHLPIPRRWLGLGFDRRVGLVLRWWYGRQPPPPEYEIPTVSWALLKKQHLTFRYWVAVVIAMVAIVLTGVVNSGYLALLVFSALLLGWTALDHRAVRGVLRTYRYADRT